MKRKLLLLICLGLLLFQSGCSILGSKSGSIVRVSVSELIEMMDKKESFVFYIGQSTCSSCAEFKPVLEQYVENHGINIYYLEMDTENEAEFNAFREEYTPKLLFTPTTYVVVDGTITDYRVNKMEYKKLREWLDEAGISND